MVLIGLRITCGYLHLMERDYLVHLFQYYYFLLSQYLPFNRWILHMNIQSHVAAEIDDYVNKMNLQELSAWVSTNHFFFFLLISSSCSPFFFFICFLPLFTASIFFHMNLFHFYFSILAMNVNNRLKCKCQEDKVWRFKWFSKVLSQVPSMERDVALSNRKWKLYSDCQLHLLSLPSLPFSELLLFFVDMLRPCLHLILK